MVAGLQQSESMGQRSGLRCVFVELMADGVSAGEKTAAGMSSRRSCQWLVVTGRMTMVEVDAEEEIVRASRSTRRIGRSRMIEWSAAVQKSVHLCWNKVTKHAGTECSKAR
jgi:hypothetical protein